MILVVGGAGYIGSHMCRLFREAGIAHLVFDNLSRGHAAAIEGSTLNQGDLRDREGLRKVFLAHEIEAVFHFAALIEVGESIKRPAEFYENNVLGVWNLLEAMREAGVDQFVFSSTAAVYGEPEHVPIVEEHPTRPKSPYGDTKLAVERMLDAYDQAYGLRSVRLRYFNAAGAWPDGSIGEDHNPETHLIPLAIQAATGARPPLQVFGDDYATPDGTCVRDYVHVIDLADAHILALERLRTGGKSATYNLGNGEGFSVRDVISTVQSVTGLLVPWMPAPRRAGDPAVLVASSGRVRSELGWKPQYPGLETIVEHAWMWHRSHPGGYHD